MLETEISQETLVVFFSHIQLFIFDLMCGAFYVIPADVHVKISPCHF